MIFIDGKRIGNSLGSTKLEEDVSRQDPSFRRGTGTGRERVALTRFERGAPGLPSDRPPRLPRGCSSAGRAPVLQAGGRGFDPHQLHHARRHVMPAAVPSGTAAGIAVSIRGGKRSAPAKWSLTIWTGNRQFESKRVVAHPGVASGHPVISGRLVANMVKLLRAHGECLGASRRRRTWLAAISSGEPLSRC